MASLSTSKSGTRSILLVCGDGVRRPIRLGRLPAKAAQAVLARVEELAAHRRMGTAPGAELASWVASLSPVLHVRLARLGLVDAREEQAVVTLGELIRRFRERSVVKASTRASYAQTTDSLVAFFGEDRDVATITPEDADLWRVAIAEATAGEGRRRKKRTTPDNRLSKATIAKRVHTARRLFGLAVRWGFMAANPFGDVKPGSQSNPTRNHYVDGPTIDAVLDACPSPEWRALIGLCRYAGLRCPSEAGLLRWQDVDFHAGRLQIRSPKTEGHGEAHAMRLAPLVPRLRLILTEAFEAAPAGSTLVVPMASRRSANLRTGLLRVLDRAHCQPWPRLFQNLRSSCEMDWIERFPLATCARWLGHSPKIALEHYTTARDSHFREAVAGGVEGVLTGGAESGALERQKAAQQGPALECTEAHEKEETAVSFENHAVSLGNRRLLYNCSMGDIGLEPMTPSLSS